jgi:hypothetical protein
MREEGEEIGDFLHIELYNTEIMLEEHNEDLV